MAAQELFNTYLFNDPSLTAYYRLSSTADSKGANTLTNNNTVAFNAGLFGNAADFSSSNTNKSLTRDGNTPVGITLTQFKTAWSISGWINEDNQGAMREPFGMQVSDGTHRANTYLVSDTGVLKLNIFDGAANTYSTGISISTGIWYPVVILYTGTNLQVWLSGSLILNQARVISSQADSQAGGFGIGCERQNNSSAHFLSGLVDDVGVFSRTLTGGDITFIANGAPSGNFSTFF